MQDRFIGDVGDFGKYGLLRALTRGLAGCEGGKPTGLGDGERQLRLGVIWHYIQSSQIPPPGQAYNYICNPGQAELLLRECDGQLFQILESIVRNGRRSIAEIEQAGALPDGTVYFRDEVPTRDRDEWFERAMIKVMDCDLIFLDPDNGLVHDSGNPDRVKPKHASYQEAVQFWQADKSLVIYQDATRRDVPTFAWEQRCRLEELLPGSEPIALWYRRRTARILWVIPNPGVANLLHERVDSFMKSCWGDHFTRVDC